MSFQRAVTPLRDTRPMNQVACAGGCGQTVKTRCSWSFCPDCDPIARAYITARVRGLSGSARREALNAFWGSQERVTEALAALRAQRQELAG